MPKRHGGRFDIELAGLREIGLLVKIVDREKRGRAFACGGRDDRRVGQREAAVVEEIAGGLDDLGAHAKNGGLALRAHPEMAMLHQEVGAVLFGRDGIRIGLGNALHDLHVRDIEFVSAVRALVGADFAFDDHTGFLGESLDRFEDFGRDGVLRHNALNDAGAVAKMREQQFAALAQVVEPAADGDGLAFVLADFGDRSYRCRHKGIVQFGNFVIG